MPVCRMILELNAINIFKTSSVSYYSLFWFKNVFDQMVLGAAHKLCKKLWGGRGGRWGKGREVGDSCEDMPQRGRVG